MKGIIQKIKNLLKRILPPPTKSFLREIEELHKRLDRMESKAQQIDTRIKNSFAQLRDDISDKKIYWNNEFERGLVLSDYGNVVEMPNFEAKFLRLIYGLDAESTQTIIRIIARQQKYLSSNKKSIDLFTREEQHVYVKIKVMHRAPKS